MTVEPGESKERSERRRRDPAATREAILEAAEQLFVVHGPAQTPMSQIARRAGVTKSLIHHHFGSKDELWDAVKKRRFVRYYEVQKQMLETWTPSAELVRESLVAYFRFLEADPDQVRFMIRRFIEPDDPCLDLEKELFDLGVRRIREAQQAGDIRADIEPYSIIKSILALAFHWFETKNLLCQMLELEDPDSLDERFLQDAAKILMNGLMPPAN